MDTIILCGGFGTRLRSISEGVPKALMPVGNRLFIDVLLNQIRKFSNNIYLSLCYRPELFFDYLKKSNNGNIIKPIIENEPLGTGGAINYVIEKTNISSPFFVINGDSLSGINLIEMCNEFKKQDCKAMIGVSKVKNTERYGTVSFKNDKIISFNEKTIGRNMWINNGHYIFQKEIFHKQEYKFSLENDLFPKLVSNGELGVFKVENDYFVDMGIPDDYHRLVNEITMRNNGN